MSQKSYNNTPTLYLVPTPIGNFEDMTLRGIKILKEVDYIFSEDTRTTSILLKHFDIKKPLISSHKFNEDISSDRMLELLSECKNIALVTDRGSPLISDPGFVSVRKICDNGYNVVALPGANAFIPALSVSGIDTNRFLFYGFLSNKASKRKEELEKIRTLPYTIIFYEAPHRMIETLKDINKIFGNRAISVSREISKKYEEVYRGKIEDVLLEIVEPKGEFVIVVDKYVSNNEYDFTVTEHVNMYLKEGLNLKEAYKRVAKDRKISKSMIYNEYVNKKR